MGLAGSALAKELLDRDVDFLLVNRRNVSASSMVAAGIFNPVVFKRLTLTWLASKTLPKMFDFYRAMEDLLEEKFLIQMPLLKLLNQEELDFWEKRSRSSHEVAGFISSITSKPKLRGVNSFDAYAEIGSSGYVRIKNMLLSFAEYLTNKGRYIESDFEYKDLIVKKDSVEWRGIKAKKIIFCQGVLNQGNPYFNRVTFYPVLGEILRIRSDRLDEDKILNKNCFILPQSNHEFLVGSTYHWSYNEIQPTEKGRTELFVKLQDILDHVPHIIDFFAGVRPTIKDRRPVLGFHPDFPSLGIFNGLGTRGVMLAPYFAEQMANLFENPDYKITPEVKLQRFLNPM